MVGVHTSLWDVGPVSCCDYVCSSSQPFTKIDSKVGDDGKRPPTVAVLPGNTG